MDDVFSSDKCDDTVTSCCNKLNQDRSTKCGKSERPYTTSDANNNQLKFVGLILEEVYRNARYPKGVTELEKSLYEEGISRADLWAFAGLVGLKYAAFLNNDACNRTKDDPKHKFNSNSHFHIRQGK